MRQGNGPDPVSERAEHKSAKLPVAQVCGQKDHAFFPGGGLGQILPVLDRDILPDIGLVDDRESEKIHEVFGEIPEHRPSYPADLRIRFVREYRLQIPFCIEPVLIREYIMKIRYEDGERIRQIKRQAQDHPLPGFIQCVVDHEGSERERQLCDVRGGIRLGERPCCIGHGLQLVLVGKKIL